MTKGTVLRKLIHLCGIGIPVGAYYLPTGDFRVAAGGLFAFAVLVEVLRATRRGFRAWFSRTFGSMLIERETRGPTAATFLFAAVFLVSFLYSREVVVLCLLYLIVGDTLAYFVGMRFGRIRYPNGKSLEGTLGFVAFSVLVSLLVPGVSVFVKGTGIAIGAFLEALEKPLDDNLLLPLGSGLGMEVISKLSR